MTTSETTAAIRVLTHHAAELRRWAARDVPGRTPEWDAYLRANWLARAGRCERAAQRLREWATKMDDDGLTRDKD